MLRTQRKKGRNNENHSQRNGNPQGKPARTQRKPTGIRKTSQQTESNQMEFQWTQPHSHHIEFFRSSLVTVTRTALDQSIVRWKTQFCKENCVEGSETRPKRTGGEISALTMCNCYFPGKNHYWLLVFAEICRKWSQSTLNFGALPFKDPRPTQPTCLRWQHAALPQIHHHVRRSFQRFVVKICYVDEFKCQAKSPCCAINIPTIWTKSSFVRAHHNNKSHDKVFPQVQVQDCDACWPR